MMTRTLRLLLLALLLILAGCQTLSSGTPVPAPPATSTARPAETAISVQTPSTTPRPTATPAPTPLAATATGQPGTLSAAARAVLDSLEQVDDFPLYRMDYPGNYEALAAEAQALLEETSRLPVKRGWACSLFASLEAPALFGRNFDWTFSPALLLYTDPPEGYASVSMVNLAFLMDQSETEGLLEVDAEERMPLLLAPLLPLDGMNEHGLAVGVAAVPFSQPSRDPARETIGSLGIVRVLLDQARTVAEAVALMEDYNISMAGGPPLHYLLADAGGAAALVEFKGGEMIVMPAEETWHATTNFVHALAGGQLRGHCPRYDTLQEQLVGGGVSEPVAALSLLEEVAQGGSTQWSIVYELHGGSLSVAMGRDYQQVYRFDLPAGDR